MNLWTEIVNTALIGCERKPLSLNESTGELGVLLGRLDQNDCEGSLLSAAALVAIYDRFAALPMKDTQPTPEACEPEDAPHCRERAATYLAMILRGEHPGTVPEWIGKATEAGVRAPEECLPELLEFGRKHFIYAPEKILPALGARGRWLAAQNPRWAYATAGFYERLWESKRIDESWVTFEALRKRDAARARELLESCWEKQSPKTRYGFVYDFKWGLSLDDEAFLERALDDKREDGHIAAHHRQTARLLASLPDSALCRRMFERARPLLRFKLDDQNRKAIEVRLPEECDEAMQRDGVNPDSRIGSAKVWWLQQMLWSIPPKLWSQESGWTVNELIEAAYQSEWTEALIHGWETSAMWSRDAEWVDALFNEAYEKERTSKASLFDALPQARKESLAIEELRTHLLPPAELPEGFIYRCAGPWSEALSRLVIDWLIHHLEPSWYKHVWPEFFNNYVPERLNPKVIPETISRITEATNPPNQRAPEVERFLKKIQASYDNFQARNEMLNAF